MKISTLAFVALTASTARAYVQNWNEHLPNPTYSSKEVLRRLHGRASTCPTDNPTSCASVDSKLPANFCCASTNTCISIDSSTSAICCPSGSDCSTIGPINCDITLQDANKHTGPIFTTNTSGQLPSCGSQCCPFGYTCGSSGNQAVCVLDKSKAKFGSTTTSSAATSTSQSGTPTTTRITSTTSTTVTVTPTNALDSNDPPPTKATNFPPGVFFAGFFPGILVGVLAVLTWVVMTDRHRRPQDSRGLNISGNGARPFISLPMRSDRHSNERSDFLRATRRRTKSLFSHRRSRTMDSPDILSHKMPTPPIHNNVPENYINNMHDVPVTPARRVAHYNSGPGYDYRISEDEKDRNFGENSVDCPRQQAHNTNDVFTSTVPALPTAAVPPLRGMNTQRRMSPPYGTSGAAPSRPRRDSGTGMGLAAPFQTPEKKDQAVFYNIPPVQDTPVRRPDLSEDNTRSMHVNYENISTLSPVAMPHGLNLQTQPQSTNLQTLTPARYDPSATKTTNTDIDNNVRQRFIADQHNKPPTIPPRPQQLTKTLKPAQPQPRPDTQYTNASFDFAEYDKEIDMEPPVSQSPEPANTLSKSRGGVSAATESQRANPAATFDRFIPKLGFERSESTKKDKHATNATTFTTMLSSVGLPDSGDQFPMPKIPDALKRSGKGKKT